MPSKPQPIDKSRNDKPDKPTTSAKQIEANRRNAQKSTGPVTPAGKHNTSLNALRHGLTGCATIMPAEDRAAHDAFIAALVSTYKPANPIESEIAEAIAENAWRLKRARAVDQNIFSLAHPALQNAEPDTSATPDMVTAMSQARAFLEDAKQLQLLSLYEQRIQRVMSKDIARLQALQAERKAAHETAFKEAQQLARVNYFDKRPYDPAADFPAENGFVFASAEINAAILREDRLARAQYHESRRWDKDFIYYDIRPDVVELPLAA